MRLLGTAAKILRCLDEQEADKTWPSVFRILQDNHAALKNLPTVCHADFVARKGHIIWVVEGGKVIDDIICSISAKGNDSALLDSYGSHSQVEKPSMVHPHVDLTNVTFKTSPEPDKSAAARFEGVPKDPTNFCYFGLPVTPHYKPS